MGKSTREAHLRNVRESMGDRSGDLYKRGNELPGREGFDELQPPRPGG